MYLRMKIYDASKIEKPLETFEWKEDGRLFGLNLQKEDFVRWEADQITLSIEPLSTLEVREST